jgi:hypothetical protein
VTCQSDGGGENHDLWLESKSALPRLSAAAQYFRDGEAPSGPIEVDFTEWFGNVPGAYAEYFLEQAMPFPDFDQFISMIWLP